MNEIKLPIYYILNILFHQKLNITNPLVEAISPRVILSASGRQILTSH